MKSNLRRVIPAKTATGSICKVVGGSLDGETNELSTR